MSVALPARAKLNLDLEIVGRRDDGFHDLRTTMQTIDLHDVLIATRAATTRLTLSGLTVTGADADNTDNSVLKAHDALERGTRHDLPAFFHLHKRIPPGSGMGGASSDAAAALKALTHLYARELRDVDLRPIAEQVGSDVPFFLAGGRARVEGRGEKITPITPQPTTPMWFAIAWPGIELSTRAVYATWDEVGGADLSDAAARTEPRLRDFAKRLGDGWRMTGSGSAFFKPVATQLQAEDAVAALDCWKAITTAVAT